MKSESSKMLASYAVFRNLYDTNNDIYGVIAQYLKKLITDQSKRSFTANEITNLLNDEYEFQIPDAVVRTSIKRIPEIQKNKSQYTVSDTALIDNAEFESYDNELVNIQNIFNLLIEFIQVRTQEKLSELQKSQLIQDFCYHILDISHKNENLEDITAFIVNNSSNETFLKQLNAIREGVILHTGVIYNNNINDFGKWKAELTIFLETEVLFDLAGFNGAYKKEMIDELFDLIKEINRQSSNKIKLKYFKETEYEFDAFFKRAETIIKKNEHIRPGMQAMAEITDGCQTKSDVAVKKSDFLELLRKNRITIDNSDYHSSENYQYNIINDEIAKKIESELKENPNQYLKPLNNIALLRNKAKENNFENIKAILLTGNYKTIKVAWHPFLKEAGNVPLATGINFLTNKFWFKLNKGLGNKDKLPKSFEILTKSKIILSSILAKKISEEYDNLKEELDSGALDEDTVKARIISLQSNMKTAEEINESTIENVLSTIKTDTLEHFIEEQKHHEIESKKKESEIKELSNQVKEQKNKEVELQVLLKLQQEYSLKQDEYSELKSKKAPLDAVIVDKIKNYKVLLGVLVILILPAILTFLFFFIKNDYLSAKYGFFVPLSFALLSPVVSIIYLLITGKTFNVNEAISKHLDAKEISITNKVYEKKQFDKTSYMQIKSEVEDLKSKLPEG